MDPNNYQQPQQWPQQAGQMPYAPQEQPQQMPTQPMPPQNTTDKPAKDKPIDPYSAQNSLQIAEIRDGIVILKDGSFRAVLQAEAINFDLMSSAEQEGVEYAYQGFLNSLYFPIQISVQSRRVNSQLYLKKIQSSFKQQNNMLLSVLIDDYSNFITALIDNTDIMNKKFYVIIPYFDTQFSKESAVNASKSLLQKIFKNKQALLTIDEQTLQQAQKELQYRLQNITDGLLSCGVRSRRLNTQELIAMYYEYYNPGINLNQSAGEYFQGLFTPVVQKSQTPAMPYNNEMDHGSIMPQYAPDQRPQAMQPDTHISTDQNYER